MGLSSRIFVSVYDGVNKRNDIWIGRVQKMGRKVTKRTLEYHTTQCAWTANRTVASCTAIDIRKTHQAQTSGGVVCVSDL
jgi:hypothetical protein